MLHLVENRHETADCPLRSDENRQALVPALEGLDAAAAQVGAAVEGAWVNPAGHVMFFLIDAPSAHAVDELIRAAGLASRTTIRTYPVVTLRALLDSL